MAEKMKGEESAKDLAIRLQWLLQDTIAIAGKLQKIGEAPGISNTVKSSSIVYDECDSIIRGADLLIREHLMRIKDALLRMGKGDRQ